ncbi:PREDICTED: ubiquitin-conjugating enzyme E2 W-like [Diuraphis noxia]|uniref:ubiquitin-conjugating enzyme E2 W-like n=1 Tax=Diuraphis noxia TaxID=143948 RepID=UPI00076397F0|nr:PREDICTED: ubiquitin-conjugating enzyme E2 W-like [Diuraphis noxia]
MTRIPPYKNKIQNELEIFVKEPSPGIVLDTTQAAKNPNLWIVYIQSANCNMYEGLEGEQFQLQIKFGSNYPFEPPEVKFVGQNIPIHPYVYDNGHICLSILADDWSPVLSMKYVCLLIQSMLSSFNYKKRPFSTNQNDTLWNHCAKKKKI